LIREKNGYTNDRDVKQEVVSGSNQIRAKPVAFHRQLFAQLQNVVKTATGRNRKQQQQTSSAVASSRQPADGTSKAACSLDRAVLKNRKQSNDSIHDPLTTKSSLPSLIGSDLDEVSCRSFVEQAAAVE
jgi:hypothetical protein